MLRELGSNKRGDTIVEVMIATAIMSVVLISAYGLSARATRLNQSAYERSRAADFVQRQGELLRAVRDEKSTTWNSIIDTNQYPYEPYYDCRNNQNSVDPGVAVAGAFHLDTDASNNFIVVAGAAATDNLFHTWVTPKSIAGSDYYDFYVYSCWQGLGNIGQQVSGTVVRLGDY